MNQPPFVVFVDVDDTFVRTVGPKRLPIPATVQHIPDLKAQGALLYCWSSAGADYARQSAEEFGVSECFTDFLPKPNLLIDDQPVPEWRYAMTVHPYACAGQTLDDYRAKAKR